MWLGLADSTDECIVLQVWLCGIIVELLKYLFEFTDLIAFKRSRGVMKQLTLLFDIGLKLGADQSCDQQNDHSNASVASYGTEFHGYRCQGKSLYFKNLMESLEVKY